ncbi:AMP-dependent synthetase/ligase [Penicillium alfredii]|uniref:Nonribosomal peptide synthetase sidC n=1 Tax=Penicillium alfredii TaxID=1506179 RepID=A0A9W9JWP4_9EURO|nr:AMP-dependent synthetase/ligase [Penicillium alfredii]KAJ5084270.1 AMP-dependent synthetase/ligase [Penicillium alfredii]
MDRFTPFPAVTREDGDVLAPAVIPWQVDAVPIPSECLALSWAIILRAFTTDETPVFLLNGAPVKADPSAETIQQATLDEVSARSAKYTAVVTEAHLSSSVEPLPTLLWTLDFATQSGALHSAGGMDDSFLHQLGRQLRQIVNQQVSRAGIHLELPVSELPALSIANPSPRTLPGPPLLHELALGQSQSAGHAIEFLAADGNIRCLSYHALDRLSSKLAAEIVAASAAVANDAKKKVVPVLLPQSVELYISWLGILKSGAAFCPLNIDAPLDRIEFILQDVAASVVITQDALAAKIPQDERLAVLTVDELAIKDGKTIEPRVEQGTSSDLAYVMYTSGSTGRPKGVGVSHLAATQSLLAHNDLIPPFERFLQFASPTFDVSVFEVFFPFMRGATLIGAEREHMLLDISHVMTEMRVDAAELTPTVAGELLRTRAAAPSLRVLLTIGEMLTQHVVDEFGQSHSADSLLHGMYGPTEAAIHCTAATHFQAQSRVNLIGKPFQTVSAYIMSLESEEGSPTGEPQALPLGQIGELVVGGPQLADGYINRPEENAKAFIQSTSHGRLYRTGDKARMLPTGEIECFGRISSGQVKLRGQRIELGEIEHVICRAPDVRAAVAIVSGGSLIAFVLVNDKGTTDSKLRDACRQLLPRFMVPGEFVLVNQFPQLPSGKIDRKGLEADFLRHRAAAPAVDQEPFRDELEETIVSCAADVIGRQPSSTESLVAAGLDSLAAIRLASHLLDAGICLDVGKLLAADCVEEIWHVAKDLETSQVAEDKYEGLQTIRQLVADAGSTRVESLGLGSEVTAVEPCSHIQQAMILETARDQKAYCNWVELQFEPSINLAAAKNAFMKVVDRYDILRSGFVEIGLKDHAYGRFTWNLSSDNVFHECEEFDYDVSLSADQDLLNPVRVQFRTGREKLHVLVHIHHSIYDGWSWQLILKELHGILLGEELVQRPAYHIVTDFFIEYKMGESAKEASTFWRDQLQGSSPANFPNFHGRLDVLPGTEETTRMLEVPMSKLNEVSHVLRVSRQTIFQAAFCYVLASYLGTGDVVFGTVFSGRTLPVKGIETVLGPCIRTLPTRMDLDKMQDVTDLFLAIQNLNHKSLEHGSLPLQDIKKASGIGLDQSLFDSALVWQESIWSNENHSNLFHEVGAAEFLEFALLLEFEPQEIGIHAKATYQRSVLSQEQANILLEQVDCVASILLNSPDLSIPQIPCHLPPSTLSLHRATFEKQTNPPRLSSSVDAIASVDPGRTAVEFMLPQEPGSNVSKSERVTYGQLQARANRLAHHLLDMGVAKSDLVAIILDKSLEFYVCMLAVVKVGAGLVPLTLQDSFQTLQSTLTAARPKFCIVSPLTESMFTLDSLEFMHVIGLPDFEVDSYHSNPTTTNEGSDVAYTETRPTGNGFTEHQFISYHNLQTNIDVLMDLFPTFPESKILQAAPQASGASIFETFFAWQKGMTLCSTPDNFLTQNARQAIAAMGVTHLHITPTMASHLEPQDVPTVQHLLASGEALTAKVHRDWAGRGLHQGYLNRGLTNVCTFYKGVEASTLTANVGRPLNNTSAMIAADQEPFHPLPRGAVGEICFGGDQVGHASLDKESSTAGRFVDHPELGKVYRTGQFGRILPNGSLILQRRDQVKLNGQHIVLEEVDRALISSELVQNSVSMVLNNPISSQQCLVAFWIPSAHARQSTGSLRFDSVVNDLSKKLSSRLSSHMVPSLLVPMEEIPMTETYRTDYSELQRKIEQMTPEQLRLFSPAVEAHENDENLSDLEKTIAVALSEVTGVDQRNIRRQTSFYKLGLDSLSAISFSRRLQELGCERLAVSTILRYSSVAQLAEVVPSMATRNQPKEYMQQLPGAFDKSWILQVENELRTSGKEARNVYPCTPLQEAMLAAESDSHSAYFNHLLLRVHVDIKTLKTAWIQMLQRHDILRTCFRPTTDQHFAYAQVVLDSANLPWTHAETSTFELDQDVNRSKSKFEGQSPVNGELPYSLVLFTDSAAQKAHLLLSIHHALYDGEGIMQLLHELELFISGNNLPEITPFYRFIGYMLSANSETSDEYWDRYLSGVSPSLLSMPKEAKNLANESVSQQIHIQVSGPFDSFKQRCKDLSVAPLNVFHAAWARLLSLYANTSDVCFGNVFGCRTIPLDGADQIVGPCFNTLPVRVKFSSTATNRDIMGSSQRSNNEILPHQLSPLRRIQRRTFNDGSHLFDTLVVLQNRSTQLDSSVWELLRDEGNMGFPLVCEIVPDDTENNIHICLHFQTSYIAHDVAKKIAHDFVALVDHTTQYPSAQASDQRPLGADIPRIFKGRDPRKSNAVNYVSTTTQISRPWSHQEEAVRDILCKFSEFNPEAVSQETTIFQLGLDSINAVQISATLRDLGYKVSAGDLLEAASIESIASLLTSSEKSVKEDEFDFSAFENEYLQSTSEQLGISRKAVQSLRPCTPIQNGMLAMFTHSHGDIYFNRMTLKFSVPLNKGLLKEAWSRVMAQHEMLRTGFVQLRNQQYPFAMVTYHEGIELPWYEARDTAADAVNLQEKHVLENLHQPPWKIDVESCETVKEIHFSALHAIYDAQSLTSIFSDVSAVYEGKTLAKPPSITATLGPILIESRAQNDEAQAFWQGLATEVHSCKFPDLHPIRTEKKKLLVGSIRCSQSRRALEDACRDIGVTLQAAGQAAWARLLAAYTGELNVVFGTVLSGRNLSAAAQEAVFPCLVTVPSPLHIEGTNRDLLSRTLKMNASLLNNQFTPLSQIQRWMGSDEPLFDTLFVYQKFTSKKEDSQHWEVFDEETKIDYPVSLELIPHSTDLEVRINYKSDVLPEEQAKILLEQYERFLENTVFSADSSSEDYSSVGSRLLSVSQAKDETIPSSVSLLHQFVENNAQNLPGKTAFEFAFGSSAENLQKKTWTYRELNENGNRIAHFLQTKGTLPGGMVAICFDKCPEASMAILGILKAGCAYVAIDPTAPISRKQFILEDSGTQLLLSHLPKKAELEGLSGVEIQTLDEPGLLDGLSVARPLLSRAIEPNDTCYCLYTSGTTGTPKGCEITHGNAVQAMLAFQRLFSGHWNEDSRWLQFASFHFDVSVLEQYWSWSVGICVTSCPRDLLFEDLPGTIQKLQITHIDLTPSLARLVHPDEVPSLCQGVFITGGEQLKQEILDAWGRHGVIYNGYGPTEVTIGCTMLPRMSAKDKPSNIGPQFDNVGSYVFRPGSSTPVLRGGIGELCVSGPLVGKGYLNRAELTKERFQSLPGSGDRIYRTGDLVRILHDGSFQFLGRIDDQVKLRGQRLEIGEINEVMKQATPELNEVATLVIKHPKQSKDQLVSFVTRVTDDKTLRGVKVHSSEEDRKLLSTIKTACHAHLPGYMVPTHIIPMSLFPLSANNKADMKVLKSIYQDLSLEDIQKLTSMSVNRTTDSAQEQSIISILAKFVGSTDQTISSWSSIYELGLDSISVIAFSRSLREAGFPQAQPSLIMKHPTITGMASALQMSTTASDSLETLHKNSKQAIEAFEHKHFASLVENIGISDEDIERIAPCTPLQEGIIYHFLSSDTPLYCSSFTFELRSSVNLEALQAAWIQTQKEVQMLRARFSPSPDGYAQVILKKDRLPWFSTTVDSEESIETARQQQTQQWISNLDGLSTISWEIGVIICPGKSLMFLNIFHALYDGNSLVLLLELAARNYLNQEQTSPQAPNFLDVLHLGPLCKDPSAKAFWTEHLAGCQNRALAGMHHESTSSILQKTQINVTEHLDHLRKSLNVTEQAVLHACWLLTLQQHYSFVPPLGIIASGRTIDVPGIGDTIGPLFNTIPSNVQFRGLETWSDVARRCHEYHVSTIPFQYSALRDIVKWLGKNSDERLFDSLFVFQRETTDIESVTEALWHPLDSEAQHEYPLAFEIVRNGTKSLTVTVAAKSHVLSSDAAQQILSSFERHLSEFAQNPDRELPQTNGILPREEVQTNGEIVEPQQHLNSSAKSEDSGFQWTTQAYTIRDVIATLAGVEPQTVSEQTSIFEVGLDSIDAIKLSSRLGKSGIKIPVSAIMRHRTVKAMTEQLGTATHHEQNGTTALLDQTEKSLSQFLASECLVPEDANRILPATPIQEAMVAEMVASGYQHYYNHEILQLEPDASIEKLQEAWRAVVKANPILRTSFVEVSDPKISASYAQIVHSEDHFDFQSVTLHGASVDTIIEKQRARILTDLAGRPPMTVTVVVDGDARYLVLSISHALYDGWSIHLLHEDVAKFYAGQTCHRPSPDAVLEQIIASSGDRALRFWRATLSNFVPKSFPAGEHSVKDSDLVHRTERLLSVPLRKAEAFCKQHGVTVQSLLVSCWSLVLAGYTMTLDVAFGLVLSGRQMADSEHVMFPTMNTVAMRVILHGSRSELVKYVHESLVEISEHQHFPLRRARPDAKSRQLFDTLFIYQRRPTEDLQTGQSLYKPMGGASKVEYPVCAEIEGVGETLVGRVACRGSALGEKDTTELLERMSHVLTLIIDQPGQKTVDFTEDGMGICGSPVFQEAKPQTPAIDAKPKVSSKTKWSSIECKIRNVLSAVSGVSETSIDKDSTIFQLGLDSISAIKVTALLKKQCVKLAVSDMLRAGTIENMARVANRNSVEITPADLSNALSASLDGIDMTALLQSAGVDPERVQKAFPATAGQAYFLSMHALNPMMFYPEFYYTASTKLSEALLERAWACLVDQTPMLRTAFLPTSHPRLPYAQIVLDSVQTPVVWHSPSDHQVASMKSRREPRSVPVTLHACQTNDGTALILQIHHALYDAVSLPYIIDRLSQLCSQEKPSETPSGIDDLSQLVAFQHVHSPVEIRRQFWQQYLDSATIDESPAKPVGGFGAVQHYYRPGLVSKMSRIEIAANHQGLSIQAIFLAVYARVHAQNFAAVNKSHEKLHKQFVVGLYLANRSYATEGLSELVAPTVNIVPLRLDNKLHGTDDTLFAAARRIQDDINEISRVEHAGVSLMEIAKWTGVRIDTCINFLRLPELNESHDANESGRVTLQAVSRETFEKMRGFIRCDDGQAQTNGETATPSGFTASTAAIADVFRVSDQPHPDLTHCENFALTKFLRVQQPTIDVEAAIREGRLDFGLFAPDSRLDRKTAERVMEDMRQEMSVLAEAPDST